MMALKKVLLGSSKKFLLKVDLNKRSVFFRSFFHSRTVHLDAIKVFYLPNDAL
jgi:hypothetical protein